ncbi:hypothetical protein AKJ16_DCAP20470 [Drosera capensis]
MMCGLENSETLYQSYQLRRPQGTCNNRGDCIVLCVGFSMKLAEPFLLDVTSGMFPLKDGKTAQPSVPRILRSPSREAIQVSSTADSVVQTDSASGKPPVSGPSQNRPLLDLPRIMSRTEVAPRNDQGGAIGGYIVLPNQAAANQNSHQQSPSEVG